MKPYDHAEASARKFGGIWEDYIEVHEWFDQFRASVPSPAHRMFLHNTIGVLICEQVFGKFLQNSDGTRHAIRDIAESHIIQDVGIVRSPQDWLNNVDDLEFMKPFAAKLEQLEKRVWESENSVDDLCCDTGVGSRLLD